MRTMLTVVLGALVWGVPLPVDACGGGGSYVGDLHHDLPPCVKAARDWPIVTVAGDCAGALRLTPVPDECASCPDETRIDPGNDENLRIWSYHSSGDGSGQWQRFTWTMGAKSGELAYLLRVAPLTECVCCSASGAGRSTSGWPLALFAALALMTLRRRR